METEKRVHGTHIVSRNLCARRFRTFQNVIELIRISVSGLVSLDGIFFLLVFVLTCVAWYLFSNDKRPVTASEKRRERTFLNGTTHCDNIAYEILKYAFIIVIKLHTWVH